MIDAPAMHDFRLDGIAPRTIERPADAEALADLLRHATSDGTAVIPWGNGTRQHLGYLPTRYDIALRTDGLNRILEHTPADLTITVEAGARLSDVQAALALHRQWLPWDPPQAATATIGGLLASGAIGPLRLGYGPPRDWILGMTVALGDGRLARSGSKVVKNVAGYDSHKLHLGAFGTLGVISEVTFKVAPQPAFQATLLASFTAPQPALAAFVELRKSPLQPIAFVALNATAEQAMPDLHAFIVGQPPHLLVAVRFAGAQAAVERQLRIAAARCVEAGALTIDLNEHSDGPIWQAIADFHAPVQPDQLILRAGAPPAAVAELSRMMEAVPRRHGWTNARYLQPAGGLAMAHWPTAGVDPQVLRAALAELRDALKPHSGYVVVEYAPPPLRAQLDLWGASPGSMPLMQALRSRWDPAGILNPGRYLV